MSLTLPLGCSVWSVWVADLMKLFLTKAEGEEKKKTFIMIKDLFNILLYFLKREIVFCQYPSFTQTLALMSLIQCQTRKAK